MIDRRVFLARAAAAAAAGGAGLGLLSSLGCAGSSTAVPAPPGLPWGSLARTLAGRLVRPGDPGYGAYARPKNLRYASVLPAGIAICANARDVATSILWARENGVPLITRSGGHSYAGYSTTTGLMIDLIQMRDFAFDPSTGIATLGGGARNAEVFAHCRKAGVAITHGRCLSVGVAGLTLGGGAGFNMRPHGVTSDRLIATEIVTADGTLHATGSKDYEDLYWACRGAGGGNYGINTSLSFQTFAVQRITAFDLRWSSDQERIFASLATALEAAPTTLGCKLSVSTASAAHGGSRTIQVQLLGQLYGSVAELLDILHPAYAIAPPTRVEFLEELPYWDAQDKLSEPGDAEYFHESSRFFNVPVGSDAVDTVFAWLRRWPATVAAASFKLFETGGRMNAIPAAATAFVHRNSLWMSSIGIVWEASTAADEVQRNLEWQSEFYAAIVPLAKGGAFQKFIDPSLTDWRTAYYGANLARLEAIKKRVDPTGVFRFQEAI
jgi:FAD/FMN-containing dehydrogenase